MTLFLLRGVRGQLSVRLLVFVFSIAWLGSSPPCHICDRISACSEQLVLVPFSLGYMVFLLRFPIAWLEVMYLEQAGPICV